MCRYTITCLPRFSSRQWILSATVYPKKYAHGFVVLCFVVVMQSFIMNSHEVFIHIHQGCVAGTGAIVRLPPCQWSKPDGYGKISQCITATEHSKAKTVCIFLGIYCIWRVIWMLCMVFRIPVNRFFRNYAFCGVLAYDFQYLCFKEYISKSLRFGQNIDISHSIEILITVSICIFMEFASDMSIRILFTTS